MFDGLHSYEIVLMVLGITMFILLSAMFVIYVSQRRKPTALLPFFALPVIMIGFPAFQKISFGKDVVTVEKLVDAVEKNPNDSNARAQLEEPLRRSLHAPRRTRT